SDDAVEDCVRPVLYRSGHSPISGDGTRTGKAHWPPKVRSSTAMKTIPRPINHWPRKFVPKMSCKGLGDGAGAGFRGRSPDGPGRLGPHPGRTVPKGRLWKRHAGSAISPGPGLSKHRRLGRG